MLPEASKAGVAIPVPLVSSLAESKVRVCDWLLFVKPVQLPRESSVHCW